MTKGLADKKICFLGAGSMAEAIFRGLLESGKTSPDQICATNRSNQSRLDELSARYSIQTTNDPSAIRDYLALSDIVVLAMKPKDVMEALRHYKSLLREDKLLVSVVAGLSMETMYGLLGNSMPIARTMPNTSSTIGLGATGIAFSSSADKEHKESVLDMFRSVGKVLVIEEKQLDILTGVSGSGPAYVYYMMEAMIEGGIRGGLSAEDARILTVQTFLGAASMVQQTEEDPAVLRRKVTSPNGTTQAAIEKLDEFRFPQAVQEAVLRSAERAAEIGNAISLEATKRE
ncbi:pyrroline-5-carboxylate reductase [Paenibacillus aurantius]|uniref:Pyrroline-5-carboxylate reductase n=1 Tax=Paenibacillus aurantius TaxID=2918900 RepID=A0AA96RFQ0_9BACL|nr:pyrroline-5-carboxylate reductase [Paenibacillus aurantius]WNQ09239.1 pyrroline-5-carboxylate reductase [Paenibacillus aurantius]